MSGKWVTCEQKTEMFFPYLSLCKSRPQWHAQPLQDKENEKKSLLCMSVTLGTRGKLPAPLNTEHFTRIFAISSLPI